MKAPRSQTASGPLFRQVANSLAARISEGAFAVGERLPTEHEIARQFGVSRHTVRQAFGVLRLEGLIASRQGVGTIVVRNTINDAYTETYSSIEELTHYAEGHPIRVDRIEDVIADAVLAEKVGCQVGQSFLAVTGRRYDRTGLIAEPVCHVVALVDARFRGIRRHLASLNSAIVSAIEAEFGHSVARITQEIKPDAISADLAAPLGVPPGTPALCITRWYHGTDERVFEIAQSHYPIGRFTYRTELIRKVPR